MRQLEAFKINGPIGPAYILEQEEGPAEILFEVEDILKKYSPRLLEILETKERYKSPDKDKNQLELF